MPDSRITDRIGPQVRDGLNALHEPTGPGGLVTFDIPRQRELYEEMNRAALAALPVNDRVEREDLTVPGPADRPDVAVRVYRPLGGKGAGPLPGIPYIHGSTTATSHRPATRSPA
ncbi:hypothetical protein ACIBUR_31515 [Streptomyces anulatus]